MPDHPAPPEPRASGRDLPVAIATGLGLAALIFGTLLTSRVAWFLVVFSAVLYAQWELYTVLDRRGHRAASALGIAVGAVLLVGAFAGGVSAMSFGLTMAVLASLLWLLADHDRSFVADRLGVTLLGVVYVPFFAAHVVLMRDLPDGAALTIAYLGAVAFYDIGAFAAGSAFGRRAIAPRVSPGKTWEGLVGGTAVLLLLALVVGPMLGPLELASSLALAAAVAVLAPVGDLFESMIKRDLDVKDMGTLLPGHGGMLDRIDAMLAVAPAAYWLMRWLVA